jgi:hypothetical protein
LIQANGYGTGYAASVVRLAYNGFDRTTPECIFFDRLVSKKGSEHDAADSTGIFLNLVHAPAVGALINLGLNLKANVASNAKANHRLG